jgi:hypothetical protein
MEMVEHAHSPTTERTFKPDPLTNDAAACPDKRYDDGAAGDELQVERARIEPHHPQPRKGNVEAKHRSHGLLKHMLADQFAHVERNVAVIFDGTFTFGTAKHWVRQRLACDRALPPHAFGSAASRLGRLLCVTVFI